MIDVRQCLFVTFTYDHAAGVFYAQLANGSRFAVSREHIGGKLENALNTFKGGVIALNSGKYVQARGSTGGLTYSYTPEQVRKFTEAGFPDVELPELELTLEDLEL